MFKVSYPAPSFRETYLADSENVRNHISRSQWTELFSTGTVFIGGGSVRIDTVEN